MLDFTNLVEGAPVSSVRILADLVQPDHHICYVLPREMPLSSDAEKRILTSLS